jgi:hypothetical protein
MEVAEGPAALGAQKIAYLGDERCVEFTRLVVTG